MGKFAGLIRRKPRPLAGIDISGGRINLLELDRTSTGYRALSYASEALPDGAMRDHQIIDTEAVAHSLLGILERSGTKAREAAIAVPDTSVISKIILMPAGLDGDDLEQQIRFDAEHHIPQPIEEVTVDFQIMGPDPGNPKFNRVLLAACRRDHIETRTEMLKMADMRVRIVDVEEYALQNACTLLAEQLPDFNHATRAAVFDVGIYSTRLTVQSGRRSLYAREVGLGCKTLIRDSMTRHGVANFDMLLTHLHTGVIKAGDVEDQVLDFARYMAAEIDRTLSFYQSAAAGEDESIDRIVVTGAPTVFPGMADLLAEFLPYPLDLGNPLAGIPASTLAQRNHIETDGPMLMVAAGLALRGLS